MAKLEIRSWGIIYEDGPEFDIEAGPPNPFDFCFDLRVDVSEVGAAWIENYQVFVCTPLGLLKHFDDLAQSAAEHDNPKHHYIFGKGFMVVREYNIDLIMQAVTQNLEQLKYYAFDMS